MEELLTVKDAAEQLKLNEQTVRKKIRNKALFAYKRMGDKEYRIPQGAIEAYLKSQPYPLPNKENPSAQQ